MLELATTHARNSGVNASFDKEMINRLENVENLHQDEKNRIFHFIDLIIRDAKTKQAYAS